MNLTIKGEANIPERVWAVGLLRDPETYTTPIRDEETGAGVAPLTVIDGDGERAMPVFTSHSKGQRGIRHYMSAETSRGAVGAAIVNLESLMETMRHAPPGSPKVHYIGVDMGERGYYPLLRLEGRGGGHGRG